MRQAGRAMVLLALLVGWLCSSQGTAAEPGRPLVLQEMAWPDVEQYLKASDMVLIPIGSTEQHGPHLPLGTDFLQAVEIAKKISARTGILVAPVVMTGYSIYHTGFPGTLSLKPETLSQVLFETCEVLQKYGFRRFLIFNQHGGNQVAEATLVHRINHQTKGVAVSVGIGAPFPRRGPEPAGSVGDPHAGVDETSVMLSLRPELVRMERAEKPVMRFSPQIEELKKLSKEHPELGGLIDALQAVPVETGKGGSLRELSSNGSWTDADPRTATAALGDALVAQTVETVSIFIESWMKAGR